MTVITVIATDGAETRSENALSRLPLDGSGVEPDSAAEGVT